MARCLATAVDMKVVCCKQLTQRTVRLDGVAQTLVGIDDVTTVLHSHEYPGVGGQTGCILRLRLALRKPITMDFYFEKTDIRLTHKPLIESS